MIYISNIYIFNSIYILMIEVIKFENDKRKH